MHMFAELEAEIESATGEQIDMECITLTPVTTGERGDVILLQIDGWEEFRRRLSDVADRRALRLETDPEYRAKYGRKP